MRRSTPLAFRDEKTRTDATKALLKKWAPSSGVATTSRASHTKFMNRPIDVIEEKLCDDVIKYLGPTLQQHKGCTLIDFFPGSAIFSSKLHKFLKPRSHILIEPEGFFHKPFLKPLLDRPGSRFHHAKLSGNGVKAQWFKFRKTFSKIVSKLPKNSEKSTDPEADPINNNVLVIGNASRMCKLGGKYNAAYPFGVGVLREWSDDSFMHQLFNKHGPVRMLWWVPERYKPAIIPPHYAYDRSNLNARIEFAYDVSEVVGVQSSSKVKSSRRSGHTERERSDAFKRLDRQAVSERMKAAGLHVPQRRKLLNAQGSNQDTKQVGETRSPLVETAQSIVALREQIERTRARLDELLTWITSPAIPLKMPGVPESLETALKSIQYPQCVKGKKEFQHHNATFINNDRFIILADMSLRLANMEAGYTELKDKGMTEDESTEMLASMKILNDTFRGALEGGQLLTPLIDDFVEDQLTFYSSSPASSLERRAYEPLQAQTSDFYPAYDMTLIDFVPRGINLSVPDLADRQECVTFLKELLKHLFAAKSRPVPEALDRAIGINAGRDLIQMVPAITDIRKGGRLDPNNLKVRALTPEMIEGLVKAFFEWPFKPENWQLLLARSTEENSDGAKTETETEG